jgi:hypothetical protein
VLHHTAIIHIQPKDGYTRTQNNDTTTTIRNPSPDTISIPVYILCSNTLSRTKSVTPSPLPTSSPNSPSPVPSPPPLLIHVEQPTLFITRDKMVLTKIIERKITKMPLRPQTKSVITKAPKKKPLTIFATPLSHAGKQVVQGQSHQPDGGL